MQTSYSEFCRYFYSSKFYAFTLNFSGLAAIDVAIVYHIPMWKVKTILLARESVERRCALAYNLIKIEQS